MSPETLPKLGFIGTGVMGQSMAGHLLKAGYPLSVHSRTRSKAETLLRLGANWAADPMKLAADCHVILSIVGYPEEVRSIYLGNKGVLSSMKPGGVMIDMTTSSPELARELAERAGEKEIFSFDAPVSGGDVGACEASLSIMVGGDKSVFDRIRPILLVMGKTVVYQGGPGTGQHSKLANQIIIAGTMIGVVEGLIYAKRAGLDLAATLSTLSQGAAGSWSLNNLAPRILKGDYEPGFAVEHFLKDMKLALEECRRMNLHLPGLELVESLYISLRKRGLGRKGTQSLILALTKDF